MQYDYRKRIIRSMQDGDVLVLQMSTCCPPLKSKLFHPNKFPGELLNSSLAVAPVFCLLSATAAPVVRFGASSISAVVCVCVCVCVRARLVG